MKIKDSFKGIFLLMIAEQAVLALPPTISDFCLDYSSYADIRKAKKNGTPIKEKGVEERDSLWLWAKDTTAKSGSNTEYQLNGLYTTGNNDKLITYNVDLCRQLPNRSYPPEELNKITISLKLNDRGIVESIEEFNGKKTDTKENIENQLDLESRHIALLIADFISTGGKNLLRYKNGSWADKGPRTITLRDKRPNKKNPIVNMFKSEFPKAPHEQMTEPTLSIKLQ